LIAQACGRTASYAASIIIAVGRESGLRAVTASQWQAATIRKFKELGGFSNIGGYSNSLPTSSGTGLTVIKMFM
jgi:hypothetical protein